MRFITVEAVDVLPNIDGYYDVAIFASGFEQRATHVASIFNRRTAKKVVVLGFSEESEVLSRQENDNYFFECFGAEVVTRIGSDDDRFIFGLLDECAKGVLSRPLKVLIDYSVMTRAWYGAILTWARFAQLSNGVEFDFAYASGRYLSEFGPLSISEIASLPGFEGISGGFRRTTAIFGLGYDKYATLAVHDRLEPDSVYCFIAQREQDDENAAKVLDENDTLVEMAAKIIRLPLTDVPNAFRLLSEQILGLERSTHIVMVPMGPKPHVLVTLLVALRMPWLTCLHAKGMRATPVQVEALGPIGICRVTFDKD